MIKSSLRLVQFQCKSPGGRHLWDSSHDALNSNVGIEKKGEARPALCAYDEFDHLQSRTSSLWVNDGRAYIYSLTA